MKRDGRGVAELLQQRLAFLGADEAQPEPIVLGLLFDLEEEARRVVGPERNLGDVEDDLVVTGGRDLLQGRRDERGEAPVEALDAVVAAGMGAGPKEIVLDEEDLLVVEEAEEEVLDVVLVERLQQAAVVAVDLGLLLGIGDGAERERDD